jgi:hypothetical protein
MPTQALRLFIPARIRRRTPTMRGLRARRVGTAREGTLIATVDIGMRTNTGYCATIDGRDIKVFKFGNT